MSNNKLASIESVVAPFLGRIVGRQLIGNTAIKAFRKTPVGLSLDKKDFAAGFRRAIQGKDISAGVNNSISVLTFPERLFPTLLGRTVGLELRSAPQKNVRKILSNVSKNIKGSPELARTTLGKTLVGGIEDITSSPLPKKGPLTTSKNPLLTLGRGIYKLTPIEDIVNKTTQVAVSSGFRKGLRANKYKRTAKEISKDVLFDIGVSTSIGDMRDLSKGFGKVLAEDKLRAAKIGLSGFKVLSPTHKKLVRGQLLKTEAGHNAKSVAALAGGLVGGGLAGGYVKNKNRTK